MALFCSSSASTLAVCPADELTASTTRAPLLRSENEQAKDLRRRRIFRLQTHSHRFLRKPDTTPSVIGIESNWQAT